MKGVFEVFRVLEEKYQYESHSSNNSALPPLCKDTIFSILQSRRRRLTLEYLRANDSQARLDELAEFIAAEENGIDVVALSSDQRKRVYIALYQSHLPKMDDAGVIAYNQPRGTIELQPQAQQLYPYIDLPSGVTNLEKKTSLKSILLPDH